MIVVLDTSAAVELVLARKSAQAVGRVVVEAQWVIAPNLYIAEAANVFWKYHHYQHMPLARCEEALDNALALPDEFFGEKDLYKEAFALGCLTAKPIYDMFFLVLARRHNGYLVSMDKALQSIAKKHSIQTAKV